MGNGQTKQIDEPFFGERKFTPLEKPTWWSAPQKEIDCDPQLKSIQLRHMIRPQKQNSKLQQHQGEEALPPKKQGDAPNQSDTQNNQSKSNENENIGTNIDSNKNPKQQEADTQTTDKAEPPSQEVPHISPSGSTPNQEKITLLTYNILADCYSVFQHFAPSWVLDWNYRRNLILKELTAYSPDIITFQELDKHEWVEMKLQELGYEGYYKRRTGIMKDGCAIFWKREKFANTFVEEICFNDVTSTGTYAQEIKTQDYLQNNVAIALMLESRSSDFCFIVSTAHLFWNPQMTHVKIGQIEHLIKAISGIRTRFQVDATIITGDFNSLPDSAVVEYLKRGKIKKNHKDRLEFFPTFYSEHEIELVSAYEGLNEPMTNFTPSFQGCLDYIFFTPDQFQLECVLDNSSLDFRGIPDPSHPSDHIPLMCELTVRPTTK